MAINGWELLLKAKWLKENGYRVQSLHVKEHGTNSDGSRSKRETIKRTRSGTPFTHGLDYLAKLLVEQRHLDPIAKDNLDALLELRDTSVHFFHQSESRLAEDLQEIGAASLKNFVLAAQEWFAHDLSEFNFYLMPLSFMELPRQAEAIVLNREEKNFLRYVQRLQERTKGSNSEYAVMINFKVKFTRSKAKGVPEVRVTNDPNATAVRLTEEQIREQYPLGTMVNSQTNAGSDTLTSVLTQSTTRSESRFMVTRSSVESVTLIPTIPRARISGFSIRIF